MYFWICFLVFALLCYGILSTSQDLRIKKLVFFVFGFSLVFFSGMRSGIGDTGYYLLWFENYKNTSINNTLFSEENKEVGFRIFMIIIGHITKNAQLYLIITSLICIGGTLWFIYRESVDLGLSIFIFLVSGLYLGMMNGVRQYLVVSILFLCSNYILKRQLAFYIILIILLSTVHTSSLFMLPVLLILLVKPWKPQSFIFITIATILVVAFPIVSPAISALLRGTVYGSYEESILNDTNAGANILRVLVMIVPPILSFVCRKNFDEDDMKYRLYSNAMIVNAICYLFAYRNWIFARIAMYLSIYTPLFYPYVIKKSFNSSSQKILKLMLIAAYSVFYIIETRHVDYMSYYMNINTELIGSITRNIYLNS